MVIHGARKRELKILSPYLSLRKILITLTHKSVSLKKKVLKSSCVFECITQAAWVSTYHKSQCTCVWLHLCVHCCVCLCLCVPEWVKLQAKERPGTKGLDLGPGLEVRSRVWG